MYTCPDMDILSIYIDNELPEPYKKEFLSHLEKCNSCKQKFERMQSISNNLKEDSQDIFLTQDVLDESFKKLNTIKRFRQNSQPSQSNFSKVGKVLPFVAAAAFLIAILPVSLNKNNTQISTNNLFAMNSSFSEALLKNTKKTNKNILLNPIAVNFQDTTEKKYLAKELIANQQNTPEISVIDIFKPDLPEQITIQIDFSLIPNMQNSEHQTYHLQNVSLVNSGMPF